MKTLIFLTTFLLKILGIFSSNDIFASFMDMQSLLETERVFMSDLEIYIERQEGALIFLRKYVEKF